MTARLPSEKDSEPELICPAAGGGIVGMELSRVFCGKSGCQGPQTGPDRP
jgi:hypothetical protein